MKRWILAAVLVIGCTPKLPPGYVQYTVNVQFNGKSMVWEMVSNKGRDQLNVDINDCSKDVTFFGLSGIGECMRGRGYQLSLGNPMQ